MATTAATLLIKVITETKGATAGLDQTASRMSKFKSGVAAASRGATVALGAIGVAAISAGKAAAEDAQSQALLANAMKNSTGATAAQVKATEDYIAKTASATGVTDDQLRPAMATLVRSTGDVEKSQKALALALDISAATGKDVGAVSNALAKGYAGNTSALGRLVPGISKAALESGKMSKITAELANKTKGAAAASAETAAGKFKRMQNEIGEAQESLGGALLPTMSSFATIAGKVAALVNRNAGAFQVIIGVVAALAAGIIVLNYALKAYVVITKVVGIVQKATWLTSGPGLVLIAIIAIVAAMVTLYKKSETFRNFVNAMWKGIKAVAGTVAKAVKAAWQASMNAVRVIVRGVVAFFKTAWRGAVAVVRGIIQAYRAYFSLVFNVIKGVIKTVVSIFKGDWRGAFSGVKSIVSAFRDFFRNIFHLLPEPVQKLVSKIKDGLGGAFSWLKEKAGDLASVLAKPFEAAEDAVGWLIDKVSDLIGWLGKIKIPDLGGLGKITSIVGLSAPAPSLARSATVSGYGAPRVAGLGVGARASSATTGSGPTFVIQGAIDPENTARQIERILYGHNRRIGLRV